MEGRALVIESGLVDAAVRDGLLDRLVSALSPPSWYIAAVLDDRARAASGGAAPNDDDDDASASSTRGLAGGPTALPRPERWRPELRLALDLAGWAAVCLFALPTPGGALLGVPPPPLARALRSGDSHTPPNVARPPRRRR